MAKSISQALADLIEACTVETTNFSDEGKTYITVPPPLDVVLEAIVALRDAGQE